MLSKVGARLLQDRSEPWLKDTDQGVQALRPELIAALIIAATLSTFALDIFTPLGVAVWVFYAFPVLLAFMSNRPMAPLATAALATLLISGAFLASPAGMSLHLAAINRGLGVCALWTMGFAGYLFISARVRVQRQEWVQSGQVALAERIGGDLSLAELGQAVLAQLAHTLQAQVGVLYVRQGGQIVRCATHAVADTNDTHTELAPGTGIVGQAIKDGRAVLLRDLPEGYLRIASGLGEGQPQSLLVVPLQVDGAMYGAVELGFAGRVAPDHLEMVERVANAIAVAIRSAEYRSRLQELLEETQRQGEELQRQAEELRTTNELLEEQSRALEISQESLEHRQIELERINTELEDRTVTLETQRAELRQSEATLQAHARQLEQASRYKSEFLANMSHELRTPLNSTLIMARLLAENRMGNLNAEQVRYAETIESAGKDLLTLINDILDLSKIEAGKVEVQPQRVDLPGLMERLRRNFEPMAQERGLVFRTEIGEEPLPELETDPGRLEQVLRNFISNALKFTDAGEVAVEVDSLTDGSVAFSVRDTGIGIEVDQQSVIFEAFRQADGSTARRHGGTGLGLSISRELAWLLGGRIELASAPGRGSTFALVLPPVYDPTMARSRQEQVLESMSSAARPRAAAPAKTIAEPAVMAQPLRALLVEDDRGGLTGDRRVVLVIEDDTAFARILRDLARSRGFQCLVAGSADDGVAMARQFLPHAIVLDIGLPDHTGLSVLDRLKHNVRTRHIPIHVVSAHDHARTALALGAVGYALKPASRERLEQCFEDIERRLDRKVSRVLVVEDDARELDALRSLLGSAGVETEGVSTGAACIKRLREATFDCVVLDLSLPDMTGFEVLDRLSSDRDTCFPPIIVHTGRELGPDDEMRLRRYSSSIIIKGAKSPERLLDEVTLFLHQMVSDLPAEYQRALAQALSRDEVLEGRRILIAEDDVRNVFALTSILEPHGTLIVIARNGREAVEAVARAEAEGQPVDLVLMDVMMPEMDGLTAIREIRRRAGGEMLPVIALTAKAMPEDQADCLAAGANDYMSKPLDVEKLLSLVRVWMPRR